MCTAVTLYNTMFLRPVERNIVVVSAGYDSQTQLLNKLFEIRELDTMKNHLSPSVSFVFAPNPVRSNEGGK